MEDRLKTWADEIEQLVAGIEAIAADDAAPDEAFRGRAEDLLREFQAFGSRPQYPALWARFQAARTAFEARLQRKREASARAADALIAELDSACRAAEAAQAPETLAQVRRTTGELRRRAREAVGLQGPDVRRVRQAGDAVQAAIDAANARFLTEIRGREDRLAERIDELRGLLAVEDVRRDAFLATASEIEGLFRNAGLGDRRRELWDEFSELRRAFRTREEARLATSAATTTAVEDLASQADARARDAANDEDIRAAMGLARQAREVLSGAPPLARQDRDRVRTALEGASRAIEEALGRVHGFARAMAAEAIVTARTAFETADARTAWDAFRKAQDTVAAAVLDPQGRLRAREDLGALYRDLRDRQDQARAEWREKQERAHRDFTEKRERTRDFLRRQEEAAARCRENAEASRDEGYADRMRGYAADHEARVAEARQAIERMEGILADIEAQLAGRKGARRRAEGGGERPLEAVELAPDVASAEPVEDPGAGGPVEPRVVTNDQESDSSG